MDEFLGEAERCLVNIEHSLCATVPLDGVLQQAEWLLRDVLLIEELLPQPDGEILTQAVSGVVANVHKCSLKLDNLSMPVLIQEIKINND